MVRVTTKIIGGLAGWNTYAREPGYVLKLLGLRGGIQVGKLTLSRLCRYSKAEFDNLLTLIDLVRIDPSTKVPVVKKIEVDPPEKVVPLDFSKLDIGQGDLIKILRRRIHNLNLDLRGINGELEEYQIKREDVDQLSLPTRLFALPEIRLEVAPSDKISQVDADKQTTTKIADNVGKIAYALKAIVRQEKVEETGTQVQRKRPERISANT